MLKEEFYKKFLEDLKKLGIRSGGVILVHPALRPFHHVPGGALTIIEGLLEAIGTSGTLLMPALSWENVTPFQPVFHVKSTPSCVGLIAETFRLLPGTIRSVHPTHSVSAIGRLAEVITSDHILDHTPCGPNSPFNKLPAYRGQILFLACDLIYNTSMHAIEEYVEPPYLYDPPINYTITDENNKTYQQNYRPHNFRNWQQRYDRISEFLTPPDLQSGLVVGTKSFLVESRALWREALRVLRLDPLYFVDRISNH